MMELELFSENKSQDQSVAPGTGLGAGGPLADRMRPQRLEEFFGQEDLVGADGALRRCIERDSLGSLILWGPPGTGKTTLARIIAHHTSREFIGLSAIMAGVKEIKEAVAQAKYLTSRSGKRTILFLDEIHRLNKSQQDVLLPFVEDGTVVLIGATTENPSFELNSALLSRAPVYVLKSLSLQDIEKILKRALLDPVRGYHGRAEGFPEDWISKIAQMANGDARRSLTLLERAAEYFLAGGRDNLEKALGDRTLRYDAKGEEHYNTVSAFIKSMRDSDPHAAVYYMARMLEAGEDPLFIVRRMVIFASEDIGNADPRALQLALNVRDAVHFVGMPEARINLAQGVTYLASAPKSNASYLAVDEALQDVRQFGNIEIPLHIRNAPTGLMKSLGYGAGYKYAHDYSGTKTGMINLPEALTARRYYRPKEVGLEKQIAEKLRGLGRMD